MLAVLQAVLRNYKIRSSQEEIAGNLTPEIFGFSMSDKKIEHFLREDKGLEYSFINYNEILSDAQETFLVNVMENDVIIGLNHHIALLLDFKIQF